MTRTLEDGLRWVSEGTALLRRALDGLATDDALGAPSALPGWTRKHLLAHIAANADALGNLITWAKTGVETPMYSSTGQRNADIEAGAGRPAEELLTWFDRSTGELDAGFASLSEAEWGYPVVTAQGRTVPVSETPWMRTRELMVHAVDLDGGVTFADLPEGFLTELSDEIRAKRAASVQEVPEVDGSHADVTAWLAGREHGPLTVADGSPAPDLGPWL